MLHLQNYKFHHRVSQTSVQFSSYLTCLTTVFTTISLDSNFAKVVSWYDNEWGYSNKVCEMARVIAAK